MGVFNLPCSRLFWFPGCTLGRSGGLFAFGVERDWAELCYQEQLGLARAALSAQPEYPVRWMFKELHIARRHSTTTEVFEEWVSRIKEDEGSSNNE